MNRRRSRPASAVRFAVESLEGRIVLSAVGSMGTLPGGSVEVSAQVLKNAATRTTLAVHAGTLGQPITFTATVRGPASAGSPSGTVNITRHGHVIETISLSPSTASGKYATSSGTATLVQQPGDDAYFFGKYPVVATFVPGGSFSGSVASETFRVGPPGYTSLAHGVKVATIATGSGPPIQSGQVAGVLYTGYLASNGRIFDASAKHGGAPFTYGLGSGQVIPGFDAGTVGMKVGETRIVEIPPAQGYGGSASAAIPANSTLLFVLTLESIS